MNLSLSQNPIYSSYIELLLEMKEYEQVDKHLIEFYRLGKELGNQ